MLPENETHLSELALGPSVVWPEPRRSDTQGPEAGPAWLLGWAAGLVMAEDRLPLGPATPWFSDTDSSGTHTSLSCKHPSITSFLNDLHDMARCERH